MEDRGEQLARHEFEPLIIEAAINGATPKNRNPHVPRSVDEIVESALACLEAGAAIVHNHNDEPNVGGAGRHSSEPYAVAWDRVLERYPDALLYPTYAVGVTGLVHFGSDPVER